MNDNRERFIEFCTNNELNSYWRSNIAPQNNTQSHMGAAGSYDQKQINHIAISARWGRSKLETEIQKKIIPPNTDTNTTNRWKNIQEEVKKQARKYLAHTRNEEEKNKLRD